MSSAGRTTTAIVNAANAYRQIITNFSNPLEFVREAISNSLDAEATSLHVLVDQTEGPTGQPEIRIILRDNGKGMDRSRIERFFNLGDSEKGAQKQGEDGVNRTLIGEKGFGTKIYLNSRKVEVITTTPSGSSLKASSEGHLEKIHSAASAPQYVVEELDTSATQGTDIRIWGYNHNDGTKLGHEQLKDYILWSTKFGSTEPVLWQSSSKHNEAKRKYSGVTLNLRGLGFDPERHSSDVDAKHETIPFGHIFPDQCFDGRTLREKARQRKTSSTDLYCRRFVSEGTLKGFPGVAWQAVFSIEGNRVKYSNPMVRRQGYKAPSGAYKVAERYGIWVCKDFIPAERVNVLLPGKGTEFLKFHAFFNCQSIRLSADRTSIGPTPPEIRAAIDEQILEISRSIFDDEGVAALLDSLEEEEFGERTSEQEKKDYTRRVKAARTCPHATFKGCELRKPTRELGVVSLLAQLLCLSPELFPFKVLDWNNGTGYDLLARDISELDFDDASKFYVECKQLLTTYFNHSLSNVKYVVCWDTDLENEATVTAVGGDTRKFVIKARGATDATTFFLSRDDAPNNIQVYVLRRLLLEKCEISFEE